MENRREKPTNTILDVLERLENLAEKTNNKLVLFFDEFQCLGEVAPDHGVEGILRQVRNLPNQSHLFFPEVIDTC